MMVGTLCQDLKHGGRMLRKNPGFAVVAMASIAIGVGANAAMFSLADTLVLRPLPVPRASEIVTLSAVVPNSGFLSPTSSAVSYPDYEDVRDQARSFANLVAFRLIVASFADRADQPTQRKFGMAVSGNLFDALGIQAARGRALTPEDDRVAGRDAVVVLDHELWQQQFASDPAIVGRQIRLGGVDMTVVGVLPIGFTGPDQFVQPSFYVPFAIMPALTSGSAVVELKKRDVHNIAVKGRLKPGVSIEQAAQEVSLIAANLARTYPDTNRNQGLTVRTEFDARVQARPQLAVMALMLITLSMIVLLVACANVAGLLASRAPVRAREMAMRLAIGAGRLRITRQLLAESLLVAVGGGAIGLLLGSAIIAFLRELQIPTDVPLKLTMDLSDRVLAVGFTLATLSAVGSSLIPAWQSSRTDLVSHLKNQGTANPRRQRLWGRNLLVSGQVGLSLVLLTAAVFLYRAYQSEYGRGPGFRTDHLLLTSFQPDLAGYDVSRAARFQEMLRERAAALPGVRSVAFTSSVPFDSISIENTAVAPEGFQFADGTSFVRVRSARVDAGYFETFRIGITNGRAFHSSDTAATPRVAVVNETFASRYWPRGVAIGKRFRLTPPSGTSGSAAGTEQPWIEVVGIAADTRYRSLAEGPTPFIYYPLAQNPAPDTTIVLHTESDPASFASPLRAAVRALDPNMPVFGVQTMEDFYKASAVNVGTMLIQTVGAMGLIGLLLSVVGLYGLVAYAVNRRTREIGIRMAVGAQAGTVLRMVMRQGLVLAGAGTLLGVVASAAASGLLRAAFPFPDVPRVDLTTYALVVPTLCIVTLLAAYIPARRAARIDPLRALRQD
jgi:macrolide transport system ATP-binding/permease protein